MLIQRISHFFLYFIVITLLNGCFFNNQATQRWQLAPQGATSFTLSRDGRFALLYSAEQHLQLWDLQQNKSLAKLGELDNEHSTISHLRISDNGRFAIAASQMNFAVWDLAWAKNIGLWSISDGIIRDVDISNNGKEILLGLTNGKAISVNLVTGRRLEFLAHQEKVNSIALSPNGKFALTGGNDKKAYLWNTQTGLIIHQFEHPQRIAKVALQRDGKLAFTSDIGNDASIWDLKTGKKITKLHSWSRQLVFSTARFTDDGSRLATGTPSGKVMVWDTSNGKKIADYNVETQKDTRPPRAVVYDTAFTSDQNVISATSAGIAEAWQLKP